MQPSHDGATCHAAICAQQLGLLLHRTSTSFVARSPGVAAGLY